MTDIDTDKLRALDEEPYLCAGCGRPFIAERSQCDCATGVGFRRSDHHQIVCEQAREVTISLDEHRVFLAMAEENKRLREALEPFAKVADALQSKYSRPLSGDLLPSPGIPLSTYRAARDAYALGNEPKA